MWGYEMMAYLLHRSSCVIFSADVYLHWALLSQQSVPSTDADLDAMNDLRIDTCVPLGFIGNGGPFILQGNLSVSYKYLTAHVMARNMSTMFATDSCKAERNMMMTHAGNVSGWKCRPFCGVLNACDLEDITARDDMAEYIFFCRCKDNLCSELLISVMYFEINVQNAKICNIIVDIN